MRKKGYQVLANDFESNATINELLEKYYQKKKEFDWLKKRLQEISQNIKEILEESVECATIDKDKDKHVISPNGQYVLSYAYVKEREALDPRKIKSKCPDLYNELMNSSKELTTCYEPYYRIVDVWRA